MFMNGRYGVHEREIMVFMNRRYGVHGREAW